MDGYRLGDVRLPGRKEQERGEDDDRDQRGG
jgi:hypothetical protein